MARIRTIKPQFFFNETLAELSAMNRLLFIGLWTQADREGRLLDRPKRLKAEIFPYESFDINRGLDELDKSGFIIRYKVNVNISDRVLAPEQPETELELIQIKNFLKHQKIDKVNEKESEFPAPQEIDYYKSSGRLVLDGEGKGKEGKGEDTPPMLMKDFKMSNCKLSPTDMQYIILDSSLKLYNAFVKAFPDNRDLPSKTVKEWSAPVKKLIKDKGYTFEQIAEVFDWALDMEKEDKFWRGVILDTEALERNFEKVKQQYYERK